MFSGIVRYTCAVAAAIAVLTAPAALSGTAMADPSQDRQFFELLGEKDIPPVDNDNSLITTAHKVCSNLDDGMSLGDMVDLIRNNGYNENPLTRLQPQRRITATINRFITASVEAYCPSNKGKIASIAAYRAMRSPAPVYRVTAYTHNAPVSRGLVLASLIGTVPAGEIAPTKPIPIPAQPPPAPQEVQPAPQEPPPPPRRVQPAPQEAPPQQAPPEQAPPQQAPPQQAPPEQAPPQQAPPQQAPPPEAEPPPQVEPPAAPPEQPAPPGHVRLAP